MEEANLLVTFEPTHKEAARAEIEEVLREIGEEPEIIGIEEGMAAVKVSNPKEAVKAIASLEDEKFKYTFFWWPVDRWCKAEIEEMKKHIKELQESIGEEEKWKMDLSKRKTTKEWPKDLIIQLTEVVDKPKVDLENPEKIIKVVIIGEKAAISLLKKDELVKKR